MKVILLQDVKGIGKRFEEKEVSEGYAINFLIPKKLATPAIGTKANEIRNQKASLFQGKIESLDKLSQEVKKLSGQKIVIKMKANESGHLFAALNQEKLSNIFHNLGAQIPANLILIPSGIKNIGEHVVSIKIGDKGAHVTLSVEAE